MNYLILKGGVIVDVAGPGVSAARITALKHLPINYKKGDKLKPSEYVSIFKFIEMFGE